MQGYGELQVHQGSPQHRFERNHGEGAWGRLGKTQKSTFGVRAPCRRGAQAGLWKTVPAANGKHPENPTLSVPMTPSRVVSLCFMRSGATLILCPQDSRPSPPQHICVQWLMQTFAEQSKRHRGSIELSG